MIINDSIVLRIRNWTIVKKLKNINGAFEVRVIGKNELDWKEQRIKFKA